MIPLVNLQAQYQQISDEVKIAINKVLDKCDFILGESVSLFEDEFAKFSGAEYCIGVSSGTDALHLALKALDISPGDEVITASNTYVATVLAISYCGAKPVLVDIDPQTFNIDISKIEASISSKTKAIIPVHLYGRPVDMDAIMALANKYNLKVVEDASQAHGALWRGKQVGSFGDLGCFSFYPGKNLGAYGDAGGITTSDVTLYEKLRLLRNYGSPLKYHHDSIGYNNRLDTLQAAILRVKLKYLSSWNSQRAKVAELYEKHLGSINEIVLPQTQFYSGTTHVYHLYVVRTKKRNELLKFLMDHGIQASVHYPIPIYSLGAYKNLRISPEAYPITELFSGEILSLPMFPELMESDIVNIAEKIKLFFSMKGLNS